MKIAAVQDENAMPSFMALETVDSFAEVMVSDDYEAFLTGAETNGQPKLLLQRTAHFHNRFRNEYTPSKNKYKLVSWS